MRRLLHQLIRKTTKSTKQGASTPCTKSSFLSIESLEERAMMSSTPMPWDPPVPKPVVGQPAHLLVFIEALPMAQPVRFSKAQSANLLVFFEVLGKSQPPQMEPLINATPVNTFGQPVTNPAPANIFGQLVYNHSVVDQFGDTITGQIVQVSRPQAPVLPPGVVYPAFLHVNNVMDADGVTSLAQAAFTSEFLAAPGAGTPHGTVAGGTYFTGAMMASFDAGGFWDDEKKWAAAGATLGGMGGAAVGEEAGGIRAIPGGTLGAAAGGLGDAIVGAAADAWDATHPKH
jgi:hypothetical protein